MRHAISIKHKAYIYTYINTYVYVYIYIYIYIYVYIYTYIYVRSYVRYTYVCIRTYVHICAYVRTYTRTYVRTYVPYAFDNCTCATRFLTPSFDLRHAHLQRFETSYFCTKCHQTNESLQCSAMLWKPRLGGLFAYGPSVGPIIPRLGRKMHSHT